MTPLPAGNFSEWLRAMRGALAGGPGMQVACGDCVGCCTSSYLIKVRPGETGTLARIPAELLVDAPGDAGGTKLMGFDARGHCPMFRDGGCTIYPQRPDTCRTYDCRVFTAAGIDAGDKRPVINQRVARWQFAYPRESDHAEHRAVMAAAQFLRQHPVRFPGGYVPSRPADIAVLAVKAYGVFLHGQPRHEDAVAGIIEACTEFDRKRG
ncbi:MAG TPA: YkgJ family cysteine cluster protein [Steroidobacteraceae bacterium]|nr:YkgJ family cysteine cluster protein [Steroidobacteraceae bacterium]